jgi:hypothetical protein
VRVDADAGEGELAHVGAADEGRTGAPQPGDRRTIGDRRRGIGEHRRAGRRGLAADVEQVLDRDREAGQRRQCGAGAEIAIDAGGGRGGGVERRLQESAIAQRAAGRGDGTLDQGAGALAPRLDLGPRTRQVGALRSAIIDGFFSLADMVSGGRVKTNREPATSRCRDARYPVVKPRGEGVAIRAGF